YICGMSRALRLAVEERQQRVAHVQPLRDLIIERVLSDIPSVQLTGHPQQRLPNHASFVFEKVDGNALLMMLDVEGFACSSGSASKTGSPEPSEVLRSTGFTPEWALGSLRVTLGVNTTREQIDQFLDVLPGLVERARHLTGVVE